MGKPAKWGDFPALFAHGQGDKSLPSPVNATSWGELLVSTGAKSCSCTYNANNLIETMELTYEVDGSDVTKTFTFTYNDSNLVSSWTVA